MVARRKRKPQQVYKVNMEMQAWDLAKAGAALTIRVRARSGLLGTIEIGQGSFRWTTARAHSPKRIPWKRLAEKLDEIE